MTHTTTTVDLHKFLNGVIPINLVMTNNKVSTLTVNFVIIPTTVTAGNTSPTDHLEEPADPEPPPDLTNISAADVPAVMHLLDDVFDFFNLPVRKEQLNQHIFYVLTKLQMDSGKNISITNDLSLLNTYWDIMPYWVLGLGDGVWCTKLGIFHLEYTGNTIIPVKIYLPSAETLLLAPTPPMPLPKHQLQNQPYTSLWSRNSVIGGFTC